MRDYFFALVIVAAGIGPAIAENQMPLVPSTLQGTVVSVTKSGSPTCEVAGTAVIGEALYDKRHGGEMFWFSIAPTAAVPDGVGYFFEPFVSSGQPAKAVFNLPLKGFTNTANYTVSNFHRSPIVMTFTLTASTPSQDGNTKAGTCNMVYDLTFKTGVPKKIKDFLKSLL
jgi:hypothetical protein